MDTTHLKSYLDIPENNLLKADEYDLLIVF
jgi:hypothetical protein